MCDIVQGVKRLKENASLFSCGSSCEGFDYCGFIIISIHMMYIDTRQFNICPLKTFEDFSKAIKGGCIKQAPLFRLLKAVERCCVEQTPLL